MFITLAFGSSMAPRYVVQLLSNFKNHKFANNSTTTGAREKMLSVANKPVMLSVIILNVVVLSVVMLSVIMLNVVVLSAVMLNVVAQP